MKNTKPKRIVIVEDDPSLEVRIRRVLKSMDPDTWIDWSTNADEALCLIQSAQEINGGSYDLVVADIFLEGHSTGIDLWENCQREFPEIPVLLMSGMETDSFFRAIGENRVGPPFLSKPFTTGECLQMMEGLLHDGERNRWNR